MKNTIPSEKVVESVKPTVVRPSWTVVSTLPSTSEGVHPVFSTHYQRKMKRALGPLYTVKK